MIVGYRLPGLLTILGATFPGSVSFTLILGGAFSSLDYQAPLCGVSNVCGSTAVFHGSEGVRITFQTIQREFAQSGSNRSPICYRSRRRAHLRQSAFLSPGPFEDALNVNYAVYIGSGRNYLFTSQLCII